jgi:hypothetical protein
MLVSGNDDGRQIPAPKILFLIPLPIHLRRKKKLTRARSTHPREQIGRAASPKGQELGKRQLNSGSTPFASTFLISNSLHITGYANVLSASCRRLQAGSLSCPESKNRMV